MDSCNVWGEWKSSGWRKKGRYGIIAAKRLLYISFQPFFSPLPGQPKNLARYHSGFAVVVYNIYPLEEKGICRMELWEKTVESKTLFEGKIITVRLDQAELPNGQLAGREVVEHPGGVAILPLFDDGTVSIVRQFRYPFQHVVTELPAGKLERGEDHRPAALRELEEEVGVRCGKLTYLGCLYLSPGFSTEVLHMYLAQELTQGDCHPDEDEFLEAERVPFAQLLEQVMSGEIVDAKTVALVLKVKQLLDL